MSSKIEELKSDMEEFTKLINIAQRHRVRDALSLESRRVEEELNNLLKAQHENKPVEKGASSSQTIKATKCYDVKLNNYAWDQSDKYVKIFVSLKNVQDLPAENISCAFTNRNMELKVNGLEGRNYILPIINFMEEINPEKSLWKVKTDNVLVMLAKTRPGFKWSHVTLTERKAYEARQPKKQEGGGDPSLNMMDMMKQMYDDGDDDMKRTIAKAWTENQNKQPTSDLGF